MITKPTTTDREVVLTAALDLARTVGYTKVTREGVSQMTSYSPASISAHFGTMVKFRRAIMSAAIVRRDLVVLAQGLAMGDPKARSAPQDLKRDAVEAIL